MHPDITQKLERIVELRNVLVEAERELRSLLGEADPEGTAPQCRHRGHRRVVYDRRIDEYVLEAVTAAGGTIGRDSLHSAVSGLAGATTLRRTVMNAVSKLIRKGALENAPDNAVRSRQAHGQTSLTDLITQPAPAPETQDTI